MWNQSIEEPEIVVVGTIVVRTSVKTTSVVGVTLVLIGRLGIKCDRTTRAMVTKMLFSFFKLLKKFYINKVESKGRGSKLKVTGATPTCTYYKISKKISHGSHKRKQLLCM